MANDVKTDKAGIELDLSAEVARIFWNTKWRKENPYASKEEKKAAWEAEKEENRKLVRSVMRTLEKKGISVIRK